jgi:hypothetical protein
MRQGNNYPEVHICQYVTEGSFDAYSWQLLENKSRFISQVMRGEVTARNAEDVDLAVLTASQIKAIASGNPLVLEKVGLETELTRLDRLYATWRAGRNRLRYDLAMLPEKIDKAQADLRAPAAAIEARNRNLPGGAETGRRGFAIGLRRSATGNETIAFAERELAGSQIRQLVAAAEREALEYGTATLLLGEYAGFERAGSEHIVFALVMEDVDYRALGLNYATDLRIQLHKKPGQMICTTMTTGRIESYHESQQVAAELQPYWREFKDLHVACDLSEMVRRIINSLQATALRRAGGVYFVPKGKRDELVRLREMVAGLPHLEDQPFVCAFGVPDLQETKAQMTQVLHAGMLDEVASLRADLRRLIAEGTNIREDTVISRLAAFQGVRAKAQVYADLLGLRLDRMRTEIGELETQARRLLLHDARPTETNGKKSADLPIIQDTTDIVGVGDEMQRLPLSHAAD